MPLRQLLLHNFWLKLFSLVLASLIWFVVHFDLQNKRDFESELFKDSEELSITNVPVAVLTSPEDKRAFLVRPPRVEVILKGKNADLRLISPGEVRVFVDLSSGKKPDPKEILHVNLTSGLASIALRANPSAVTLEEQKN